MTSKFLTELKVELVAGSDSEWEVMEKLVYHSDLLGSDVVVSSGFVTDFASVPRFPIAYTLYGDRAHREGVVHDYLYQTHLTTKAIADKIFLEAMKARGKPLWVRWPMYLGVLIGGGHAYKTGPERYRDLNGPDKFNT